MARKRMILEEIEDTAALALVPGSPESPLKLSGKARKELLAIHASTSSGSRWHNDEAIDELEYLKLIYRKPRLSESEQEVLKAEIENIRKDLAEWAVAGTLRKVGAKLAQWQDAVGRLNESHWALTPDGEKLLLSGSVTVKL